MNGFKRASRRQAAVVGLAVLMGGTFLGCHAGPRLFSKKDRDQAADKQELADKDKGKFINRKKARPESEYRRDESEDDDEQIVRSETKSKSKTRPSDSTRKPTNDDSDRAAGNLAAARRKQLADESESASRSSKSATASSKAAKPAEQSPLARRDPNKRPVTDLLNDSLFDQKLPETRPNAPPPAAKKSVAKSTSTAKANSLDEDPFKNSVSSAASPKRPSDQRPNDKRPIEKVANVNFDDEELDLGLDDEVEEEAAEQARERAAAAALAAKKRVAATKPAAPAREQRVTPSAQTAAAAQRKFLDYVDDEEEAEEQETESSAIEEQIPQVAKQVAKTADKARASQPTVKRPAEAAKSVAGQSVVDRRQSVQKTVDDWRREMERDDLAEPEREPVSPAPRTTVRSNSAPLSKSHLSPASLDEFVPPAKSQGAVLDGELIIDTNTLPSRFQRGSMPPTGGNGAAGRTNPNTGANIEIIPGATQNRTRTGGQISLQSSSDRDNSSGLTTADYEQSIASDELGSLPSLKLDSDSETGPKLAALEGDSGMAPPPPVFAELAPAIGTAEPPSGSRGWKRTLLVLGSMASAVAIGFALRHRNQMTAAPIRVPTSSPPSDGASRG